MEGRAIKPMQLTGNVGENWRQWKQKFEIYSAAIELDAKSEKTQCAQLLFQMGEEVIDIFNTFSFLDNEKNKIATLIEKFDNYFLPKKNITYERYKFFTARQNGKTIEEFVLALKEQAQECDFPDHVFKTELVKTMLIVGIKDEQLREHLLHQEYTLEKAIEVSILRGPNVENDNLECSAEKLYENELNIPKCDNGNMDLQLTNKKQMGSTEVQFTKTDEGCSSLQTMGHPLTVSPNLLLKKPQETQNDMKVPRSDDNNMKVDRFRSDATFRFSIPQASKIKGSVRSPPQYVRNLPWIIEVRKTIFRRSKRGRYISIKLECNASSHSTTWSCYASAVVRLLPPRLNRNIWSASRQDWVKYEDNSFNFTEFIDWQELLDGYINNDTITIEVYLHANEPRGLH